MPRPAGGWRPLVAAASWAVAGVVSGCAVVQPVVSPLAPAIVADATTDTDAGALPDPPYRLRLIGHRTLDTSVGFGGTTVGGLSGIDYDAAGDRYYVVSDDRARFGPTRFYTAKLALDADGLHDVALQEVFALARPDGRPYAAGEADAEAIRFDPATGTLWWASEGGHDPGDRGDGSDDARGRHTDPFVRQASPDGSARAEIPLDPMFSFGRPGRGPRDNVVFEGLSLSQDGRSLWVAMEGPLIEDGPMPTMRDGALARFSRHPRRPDGGFGPLAAQYAYPVAPIPSSGAWTARHAQAGVSEVLEVDAGHLLVLERAIALGTGWRIRLFDADWTAATDVAAIASLSGGDFVPMAKRLVLDFATLGFRVDNLEGLCFGPTLTNGHRTLVLVSDDNFNPGEVTQFVALEIVPHR